MSQMFFGQFLIDEGAVNQDALHRAIEWARGDNARVGQLAVEMGMLNDSQVDMIWLEQRRTDLRFVELGVVLDQLSVLQASQLLREQKRRHKPIGHALVSLGCLGVDELDDLLDRFHLSQLDLDAAHLELPLELNDDDLAPYLVEYFPKLFRRITQQPMKLQGGRPWPGRSNLPYKVTVGISGDCPLEIGIALSAELASQLAGAMRGGGTTPTDPHEISECVVEFAEILSDAAQRSLHHDGLSALCLDPEVGQLPKDGFWFPATTPDGRGVLLLSAS